MAEKKRYISYKVISETTVEAFLASTDSLVKGISKEDFLKFKNDKGVSNNFFIYLIYNDVEKLTYQRDYIDNDLSLIKSNTVLLIPVSQLNEELIITSGKNLFLDQNKSLPVYFTEQQNELQSDPKYVKLQSISQSGKNLDLQTIEENCQVWVYIKAIDQLINISPFIESVTTSKSLIGSFNINLNPINLTGVRGGTIIDDNFDTLKGLEFLNEYNILDENNKINLSFFDKYCQQNDAVFIRFEKLQLEESISDKTGSSRLLVNKQELPDQIFDMIGLVDSVSSSINSDSIDYTVNISGRDLMKVLIEDGAYLMDIIFAQGAENTFYFLGDEKDKYFKRNYANNGSFEYLFKEFLDPIETYMGFIINQLSNVGWTGDNDLFNYYKNKPEKYKIGISNEKRYLENIEQNGIWKICYLKVDPKLSDRRVIDGSFIDQDGTLLEQFKKVCQSPFVEFWGDTYKSQFNFIARQQPFDREGMREILTTEEYILKVESKDIYQINLGWETEFYSWFQFFPSNQIFGDDKFFYAANFPIIYLDKYVEHFGNHRKVIQDNYVYGDAADTFKGKENLESLSRGLLNDLKYIIESDSVLPFTRRGNIVINGDRRIKVGGFIELETTGEICYVEGVQNSVIFSKIGVNRTTTLSLKRCMKKEFILDNSSKYLRGNKNISTESFDSDLNKKVNWDNKFNYYNIVDTDLIIENLLNNIEDNNFIEGEDLIRNRVVKQTQQIKTNFGVNEEVFDFFLQRRQMDVNE